MGRVVEDYLASPSEVPIEFDRYLSCLVHPLSHRGIDGSDADAVVGTRSLAEVREGLWNLLVHDHYSHSSSARSMYHRDCTMHTQWEVGVGNACTVVGPGGVVAAVAVAEEVVVGGGAESDVESVTGDVEGAAATHTDEGRVGASDRIQDQVGDNVFLAASGLAAGFSHPDLGDSGQEQVEEGEGPVRCTRSVGGRGVEMASEGEGKYNGAHTSHMSEH